MMRIAVVPVLAAAPDVLIVTPAKAEHSACLTYDTSVNGQGQTGSRCIPG